MEFISSDTNVWFDFEIIGKIELPFRLDCSYLISESTFKDEIVDPEDLPKKLKKLGLRIVQLTEEETEEKIRLIKIYKKLSVYDVNALAMAKCRKIVLLTGDRELRKAANNENVEVIGTIGLIDKLNSEKKLTEDEYSEVLNALLKLCEGNRRLPANEIKKRIINLNF